MSNILVYATATCPFCNNAKRLLDRKGVGYKEIRVDQDRNQLQLMMQRSKRRTVPQIFIGDYHVGGYDDLAELDACGDLDSLLVNI
ncbi:glutaredoxin [Achromatium sp. WMS3]|nr:glutaredoxin [Achromatium sp. WMS3]